MLVRVARRFIMGCVRSDPWRDVWRLGALGVPNPAPGQPRGRAPTMCDDVHVGTPGAPKPCAVMLGVLCHSEGSEESRRVAEVWRSGGSGVPRPAPGQPQGRAPTMCDDVHVGTPGAPKPCAVMFGVLCHSEGSEESRRGAGCLAVRWAWRTRPRTGAATRACPYVVVWLRSCRGPLCPSGISPVNGGKRSASSSVVVKGAR